MDAVALKLHAELLEQEIRTNRGKSPDVDFLAEYSPLVKALDDARAGRINEPRKLGDGLGRWMLESNIQDFSDLSDRLAEFKILLRGWKLPGNQTPSDKA